jgi:hypothetical protein
MRGGKCVGPDVSLVCQFIGLGFQGHFVCTGDTLNLPAYRSTFIGPAIVVLHSLCDTNRRARDGDPADREYLCCKMFTKTCSWNLT